MPNNDIEVFDYLIENRDSTQEIDFLTYSMFAFHKKKWFDQYKALHNGEPPTQGDIDRWISELAPWFFEQLRVDATAFFEATAEAYLRERIEDERQDAVDDSILNEVKSYTSPLRHFGIALAMAIVAPVILGGVILAYTIFDRTFPYHLEYTPNASSSDTSPNSQGASGNTH